jgi:hypothetical protein
VVAGRATYAKTRLELQQSQFLNESSRISSRRAARQGTSSRTARAAVDRMVIGHASIAR